MPQKVVADSGNSLRVKVDEQDLKTRVKRRKYKESEQKDTEQQIEFICKICDKVFKRKDRLFVHERLHSGDQPYICKQCGKGFRSQDSVRCHLAVHSDEKAFSCDKCIKTFKTSHQMRKHQRLSKIAMSKNEPNDHKPVKCKLCTFQITSKLERKKHMRFHKKKSNPYLCSKCKKCFNSLKLLGDHYKASCKGTKKKVIKKREVKNKKLQNPEGPLAPFACHRCSKRFKTISNLGLHFISHSESDHFNCSSCKADFQSVIEYQEHQCIQQQSVRIKPKLVVKFQTCVLDPGLADGDEEQESREEVARETEASIEHLTGFIQGGETTTEQVADNVQNVSQAQSGEMQMAGQ
ncbi:gastrula zinc finger protein XlCGF52.1-like [Asterias rubens]|uniref:gastrula zinc finger protein XlCGF52.1-like n=1 Tax=Asterias rubens TaxID=7604 RepID=UPI001455ABD8|nr:gastrula zinc finger protein XlCGF52.1-like [Asterias rubens]